jgi:alkanesulfonate monooxygenase SsuD/methylene tetrahydromethanopterin reductase-like flavin-dependent oxidoreductase (luciferase family)
MAIDPSLSFMDPLACLGFIAAATSRIILGTAVLQLPYHHPVTLAKRLATIDVLSRGRMRLLTVGLGSLPAEAAAVGVDYTTRGRRADEAIDVKRLLWSRTTRAHFQSTLVDRPGRQPVAPGCAETGTSRGGGSATRNGRTWLR